MPPAEPTPAPSVDLVLHVGSPKTGTSTLQHFCRVNRDRLAASGLLYPATPGPARHAKVGFYTFEPDQLAQRVAWRRKKRVPPEVFHRRFAAQLTEEIAASGLSRVLISDEALLARPRAGLRRLRELTDRFSRSLRVVVYLRRQDDLLLSRYQQDVKTGETLRLTQYVASPAVRGRDHLRQLEDWTAVMEPDELVVRRFEPSAFAGGALHTDFLDAVGLDVDATALQPPERRNDSLDADSVEFLRLLNLYRIEFEGERRGAVDNYRYLQPLARHSTGARLGLPEAVLDALMGGWEQDNRTIAERYLHDPSGVLFREPRSSVGSTTVQLLDPARVEEYADLLELPERWRRPLRVVAEREAATVTPAS